MYELARKKWILFGGAVDHGFAERVHDGVWKAMEIWKGSITQVACGAEWLMREGHVQDLVVAGIG